MPPASQEIRTSFITAVTASRRRLFHVETNALLFLEVLQEQQHKGRIHLHAFVIMPDHVHLLITPAPEVSLEKAMQYIKGNFSFRLKSKIDVWERSYDSRRIKDEIDYAAHIKYIEQNPVRAGVVGEPTFFCYSSADHSHKTDSTPACFI